MEASRFWPICPFGARNGQICFEFLLLCAVNQEKAIFQWKQAASGPSALFGPEMVKFGPNFCYRAVDQENAVFQWKRAVSGPSALLGPEMVKFGPNFCYRAADQKGRFSMETSRFWPICPLGARNGQTRISAIVL